MIEFQDSIILTRAQVCELLAEVMAVIDTAAMEGFERGRSDGYEYGYEQGHAAGYDYGFEQGQATCDVDVIDGYNEGVADGYDEGYDDGLTAAAISAAEAAAFGNS